MSEVAGTKYLVYMALEANSAGRVSVQPPVPSEAIYDACTDALEVQGNTFARQASFEAAEDEDIFSTVFDLGPVGQNMLARASATVVGALTEAGLEAEPGAGYIAHIT